ncbi:SDR family oxidoreductase [Fulvivirga sp. RKSG066]|uniref:SDR family oxidoreductase n=1 Tax=Fulvivirga aurantia TaxID=2529383 RepID=UPI0012BBE6A5|nr:SDR family oxidoreductase [Fulvivirga aurantia]MTI19952.1 SDR family oxidoreductase [Fulvivirga aurantia]
MEKVIVAGANGTTGRHIIQKLKHHGAYDPIAMIRKEEQKAYFEDMGVSTKMLDLEEDLSGSLNGYDKVIFAAGSGSSTGKDKTEAVDEKGAQKLIDEAKNSNIKKFVMLSSMGADDPASNDQIQHYLQAKHNADEHLKESGLNYSIVRPGHLINDEGKGHIDAAPKLNKRGDISRIDVAQVLVSALDHANLSNQTVEILEGDKTIEEALSMI